jgi:hypothetical protein
MVCILPNSILRLLAFGHSKIPYQATLFANTLFSLSGMFNAVLFFFTRPNLVVGVGPSDTPLPNLASTDSGIQSHHHYRSDEMELTRYGSQRFGSLPTRGSPVASDYVAPGDLEEYSAYFHLNHSRTLPEGGGSSHRASGSASHVPSNTMSGARSYGDFRSTVSAPVEEETAYGHLPTR